jgi:hypothetical protein
MSAISDARSAVIQALTGLALAPAFSIRLKRSVLTAKATSRIGSSKLWTNLVVRHPSFALAGSTVLNGSCGTLERITRQSLRS